eukprot:scaffold1280_cov246-Pinguiococcus_pyrenoidosus.AAC.12
MGRLGAVSSGAPPLDCRRLEGPLTRSPGGCARCTLSSGLQSLFEGLVLPGTSRRGVRYPGLRRARRENPGARVGQSGQIEQRGLLQDPAQRLQRDGKLHSILTFVLPEEHGHMLALNVRGVLQPA